MSRAEMAAGLSSSADRVSRRGAASLSVNDALYSRTCLTRRNVTSRVRPSFTSAVYGEFSFA
jgi:hypothetical protein